MPIRPENKARYPKDWPAISRRIRERAQNKCERCGVPNGVLIARGTGRDAGTFMLENGDVFCATTGEPRGRARGSEYEAARYVRVVLTVAHLDHQPENCADDNLQAMCQRCHLRYDAKHHAANAHATRRKRKAVGDLFSDAGVG